MTIAIQFVQLSKYLWSFILLSYRSHHPLLSLYCPYVGVIHVHVASVSLCVPRAFGVIIPITALVIKGGPRRQVQGMNLSLNRSRLPSHVAGAVFRLIPVHLDRPPVWDSKCRWAGPLFITRPPRWSGLGFQNPMTFWYDPVRSFMVRPAQCILSGSGQIAGI